MLMQSVNNQNWLVNRVSRLVVPFLIGATFLIYFQSFFFELIYLDDDELVYEKFEENDLWNKVSHSFTSNYLGGHYYRPITLLSFVLDKEVGGGSAITYHLTNYLIHLLVCLILFFILKTMGYPLPIVFISSLFFALNPLHINAIGWIAGRGDLLSAMFAICALFIFQNYIKLGRSILLLIVFVFLFLAFLSKEASLVTPFLIIAYLFIEKKEFIINKTNISVFVMILVLVCSYYALRGLLLLEVHIDKFSFTIFFKNILILPETVSKFFIPMGIKALPEIESFTSISGIIILLILTILPIKFKNINKSRYYFGLIWFVMLMFPGMVFSTMQQDGFFYWDCRSYLPSIGLILTAAEITKSFELSGYKKLFYYSAGVYLLIQTFFSFSMIKIYKDAPSYWNSVKYDYPEIYLPYLGLYNYFMHSGNLNQAESQLIDAVELRPEESSIRQLLINFYLKNHEYNDAFNSIEDAVIKNSFNADFYIEKFISLSLETNQVQEIDNLIKKYSFDREALNRINKLIITEAKDLESKSDTTTASKLIEKITF